MKIGTKGVEPILATVLIVLVVIALAGTFLVWSGRTLGTATERGTQGTQEISGAAGESVSIVSMACGTTDQITIKNTGTVDITTNQLTIYEDDVLRTMTWTAATLVPGATTTSSGSFAAYDNGGLESTDTIRIVTQRASESSSRCA